MRILFWLGLSGSLYSYFLYPLLLLMLPKRRPVAVTRAHLPTVSVIIAAHNEVNRIGEKIENTLACDYPEQLREIIVASDASSDGTDAVALSYAPRGVRIIRAAPRRGKEHAQRAAITHAKGEVLVFTDVATHLDEGGLRAIVQPFADPRVGAVSSEDRFFNADGSPAGEGAYVRYEMALRRLESRVGGLVGLSGSFFAAHRDVCRKWDVASPSDFNTALACATRGRVAVVAPDAIGNYRNIAAGAREYRRKYRTVLRGMTALWRHPAVLNPFRYGLFAWQVWSHKVMRWAVPWFLLALFIASLSLRGGIYEVALWGQAIFYGIVTAGALSPRLRAFTPVRIAYFFMEVNAAIAHAAIAFLLGSRITLWEPSKR